MSSSLKEEVGYKRATPRAEAVFKMHMANMAARKFSRVALCQLFTHGRHSETVLVI